MMRAYRRQTAEHCLVGIALFLAVIRPNNCYGQMEADELISQLYRTYSTRDSTPLSVKFTLRQSMSAESQKRRGAARPFEGVWIVHGDFARKREKRWCWSSQSDPAEVGLRESFYLHNGEVSLIQSDKSNYRLSRSADEVYPIDLPHNIASEERLLDAFKERENGEAYSIQVVPSKQHASEQIQFRLEATRTKWTSICTVVPSKGYSLVKYEQYDGQGKLVLRSQCSEHIEVDGQYYPKHGRRESYWTDGHIFETSEFEVDELKLGASNVPDSKFHFDFPPDAVVYDMDMNVPVRNPQQVESHLSEVIGRLGSRRGAYGWWLLGLISVVVALIAPATWRLVHRHRMKH
jgi:hypothetical protein